ncbi:MAG TPA: hypothetical protein VFG50_17135 [Rhodothermales bacterium]|nr:hypothetical protein [Rhodothermales bacterium]
MKQPAAVGRITLSATCLLIVLACRISVEHNIRTNRIPVRIGETTVYLLDHRADAPGLTYLVLHDDEDTASRAALEVVRRHGGRLLELHHTGLRNVVFSLDGHRYTFDPNRIFTDAGARATLADLSTDTPPARDAVRALADTILQRLNPARDGVLVTVHNNTKGEYSALSYADSAEYGQDAKSVHVERHEDVDDFFFVTVPAWFDTVRDAGFNAVLQDNDQVTDDGSLSVWAGAHDIPYVNVEAEHGHLSEQIHMLEFLNDLLEGQR